MIYSILTNPTYINIVVLLLLVFLVLFLWRKIMILEGNFFILEKRLNLMKKDVRDVYVNNKSFNEANEVMNEVFKDSIKKESKVKHLGGGCCIIPDQRTNDPNISQEVMNNMDKEIAIMHEVVGNVINDAILNNKPMANDVIQVTQVVPVVSVSSVKHIDDDNDDVQISFTEEKIVSDPDTVAKSIVDDIETQSTTSEIVFNTDTKYSQKKLSKLGIDKLKEICSSHNLNQEGTKTQLISRILENK
jgi:hypothetical protein